MKPYYEHQGITIYHGDGVDYLRSLADDSVDMVLTDPPYKINQDYGSNIDADKLCSVSSIHPLMAQVSRVLKPGRFAVLFYDNRILPLLFEAAKGTKLIYQRQLFVYRSNSIHAYCWHGWMNCTDPICIFTKAGSKKFYPDTKPKVKHDCYTRTKMNNHKSGHPAQKPEDIIMHIIEWCTNEGDMIIDPYCGAGSVGLSATLTNRRFTGVDINSDWLVLAVSHMSNNEV